MKMDMFYCSSGQAIRKWGLLRANETSESPEETAYREVYEETGIKVKNLRLINVSSGATTLQN